MGKDKTELLYFCVGFHELSHLTRDLSHTEKKIAVKVQLFRKGFLVGMYPALLKAHLNCLVIALYNCTHTNQIMVVAFQPVQLAQVSFLQKNQTLQNVFLISVTLRWHRASVACKNQSF